MVNHTNMVIFFIPLKPWIQISYYLYASKYPPILQLFLLLVTIVCIEGFKLGSEKHTTEVVLTKNGALRVTSGIEGLSLLKTTQVSYVITSAYFSCLIVIQKSFGTYWTCIWASLNSLLVTVNSQTTVWYDHCFSLINN